MVVDLGGCLVREYFLPFLALVLLDDENWFLFRLAGFLPLLILGDCVVAQHSLEN